jgi:hypothetical protein
MMLRGFEQPAVVRIESMSQCVDQSAIFDVMVLQVDVHGEFQKAGFAPRIQNGFSAGRLFQGAAVCSRQF